MPSGIAPPAVGLSLLVEPEFAAATLPLFEAGAVDVLEWSFDVHWDAPPLPAWSDELLAHFSATDRLLGHGVTFSPLTASWTDRQDRWLEQFSEECASRRYRHVSEHFGFLAAGSFHDGAPLPVPRTDAALAIGRDRLRRLAEVCGVRVGLENLAFAFGPDDVRSQGAFLAELLEPSDGFLLLDLHNLYCHAVNFDVDVRDLLDGYPLERVVELHVSGGSWSDGVGGRVRRDTHDDAVPDEVLALLPDVLARCPGTEFVILERITGTLRDAAARDRFADDFRRVRSVVHGAAAS